MGLCPRTHWKSLQRFSKYLTGLKGPTSKRRRIRRGRGRQGGKRRERKMGGEVRGRSVVQSR